jgi:hypothetical protein
MAPRPRPLIRGSLAPPVVELPATRRICRFRPCPAPDDPIYNAVPDDGLCLNAFLLLTDPEDPARVVLGQIDPNADWGELGGMHAKRIEELGDRWMLPSRQLFLFEDPADAARSIAREQLRLPELRLDPPTVTSEAWERPSGAGRGPHWDLSFLVRGSWPSDRPLQAPAWRRLAFQDPRSLEAHEVGRHHLDVLELSGFRRGT